MERIKFSKDEKQLLLHISRRPNSLPDGISKARINMAGYRLHDLDLIYMDKDFYGITSAKLSPKGKSYMELNPKLLNPFPWDTIMKAATIIAAVAATAALFVGCIRLIVK